MKRNFYDYADCEYIDLSLVAYVKVKKYPPDIFEVCTQNRDREELWYERFKTREDAAAYANRLVALMEER